MHSLPELSRISWSPSSCLFAAPSLLVLHVEVAGPEGQQDVPAAYLVRGRFRESCCPKFFWGRTLVTGQYPAVPFKGCLFTVVPNDLPTPRLLMLLRHLQWSPWASRLLGHRLSCRSRFLPLRHCPSLAFLIPGFGGLYLAWDSDVGHPLPGPCPHDHRVPQAAHGPGCGPDSQWGGPRGAVLGRRGEPGSAGWWGLHAAHLSGQERESHPPRLGANLG